MNTTETAKLVAEWQRLCAGPASTKRYRWPWLNDSLSAACDLLEAQASEIERLKAALRYAAGQLSGYPPNTSKHPEEVYEELLLVIREAIR